MTISGIYKITSPRGRVYIGESENIEKRFITYRRLRCKQQPKLYNSFLKYGVENHIFEVIMQCDFENLKYFESCFQEIYRVVEKGLNCRYTGREDKKGIISSESKNKMSDAQKKLYENGYVSPNKGKQKSENHKKKLSDNHWTKKEGYVSPNRGKKANPESVEKQRNSLKKRYENGLVHPMKGKKLNEKQIQKIKDNHCSKKEGYVNPNKGKIMDDNIRKKISDSKKGKPGPRLGVKLDEKIRKKFSDAQKKIYNSGYISPYSKMVINTQSGFIYDSASKAYEASGLKCHVGHFCSMLSGYKKNKTNFEYCQNIK